MKKVILPVMISAIFATYAQAANVYDVFGCMNQLKVKKITHHLLSTH